MALFLFNYFLKNRICRLLDRFAKDAVFTLIGEKLGYPEVHSVPAGQP